MSNTLSLRDSSSNVEGIHTDILEKDTKRKNTIGKHINHMIMVSFLVTSIIGSNGDANGKESTDAPISGGEVPEQQSQIDDSKKLMDLLSNFYTIQEIELNKNQLDSLYREYSKIKIGPNTRIYLKSILLEAYLKMIEVGYTVNGYQELDQLVERVDELSEGKVEVSVGPTMPGDSEFTNNIIVIGEVSFGKIILEEKGGFYLFGIGSGANKVTIGVNNKKLITAVSLDTPDSIKQAQGRITDAFESYLVEKEGLRKSIQEVGRLKFQIERLEEEKEALKVEFEQETTQANKERKKEIEKLIADYDLQIAELKEIHTREIENLKSKIKQREQEIEDLIENHRTQILNINATNSAELQKEKDEANARILKLQESFSKERDDFTKEIKELQREIQNLQILNQTQVNELQKQIEKLNELNDKISLDNSDLQNEITSLKQTIQILTESKESLTEEIARIQLEVNMLITQKNDLVKQLNTVGDAKSSLLFDTQNNLNRTEALNTKLKSTISKLEVKIAELTAKVGELESTNKRLLEFEKKGQELVGAIEKIKRMGDEMKALEKKYQETLAENIELKRQNQELENIKEELIKYNQLLDDLESAKAEINGLNIEVEELTSDLEEEKVKNKSLSDTVESQRRNISSLLVQIEEIQKAYDSLEKGNLENSQTDYAETIRDAKGKNRLLQDRIDELNRELEESKQENRGLVIKVQETTQEYEERLKAQKKKFQDEIGRITREFLIRK